MAVMARMRCSAAAAALGLLLTGPAAGITG
jgi:hypothetical protein